MTFINGGCSCNSIKFQINLDKLKTIVNCHCNLCRGMNGAAFSTYAVVLEDGFTIIEGNDKLKLYQATIDAQKYFCAICGTPIYNINPKRYASLKIIHYGTMSDLRNHTPKANIYCESQLAWANDLGVIKSFVQIKN